MTDLNTLRTMVLSSVGEMTVRVNGKSMEPFLIDGRDSVVLKKKTEPPKVGDIAFFADRHGKILMHRVYKIDSHGYTFLGDGLVNPERGVREEDIFGIVTAVIRNGKTYKSDSFYFRFHRLSGPVLGAVRRLYAKVIRNIKKILPKK